MPETTPPANPADPLDSLKKSILSLEEEKTVLKKRMDSAADKGEIAASLKAVTDQLSGLRADLDTLKNERRGSRPAQNDPALEDWFW